MPITQAVTTSVLKKYWPKPESKAPVKLSSVKLSG
ncbi:hypothetical protein SVIOM342S_03761 [Streptomyces violaceorubidus]